MADTLRVLRVELTAGVAGFQKAFGQAAQSLSAFGKNLGAVGQATDKIGAGLGSRLADSFKALSSGGGISGALAALGPAGIAAGAGIAAVGYAANKVVGEIADLADQAEQWTNLAASTGLGITTVQQLSTVLKEAQIAPEALATGMRALSAEIASGGKDLQKFGIDITGWDLLSQEERLQRFAQAVMGISDPAIRSAAAQAGLGRTGTALIPILNDVASGAYKVIGALGDEQVRALTEADKVLDEAGRSWQLWKAQAISAIVPVMNYLSKPVLIGGGEIRGGIGGLTGGFAELERITNPETYLDRSPLTLGPEEEETRKKWQKMADDAKRTADQFQTLVDQLGGKAAQSEVEQLARAFGLLGVEGVADLEALRSKLEALQKQGAEIGDEGLLAVLRGGKIEIPPLLPENLDLGLGDVGAELSVALAPAQESFSAIATAAARAGLSTEEIRDALTAAGASGGQLEVALASIPVTFGSVFKEALAGLPQVILGAIEGGGDVGRAVGASLGGSIMGGLGKSLTESLSGIFGKTLGGALGSIIPGLGSLLGSALGGVIDKVIGIFHKPSWVKVGEEAGRILGMNVSKELAKKIEETSKTLHISIKAATLLNLDEAIKESGKSASEFGDQIEDLMRGVADSSIPLAEGVKEIGSLFEQLGEEGTDAAKKLQIGMIQAARASGTVVPEMQAAVKDALDQAVAGVAGMTKGLKILTPEDAQSQAYIFAATFWGVFKEQGVAGLQALSPAFKDLQDQLAAGGFDVSAILGPIQGIMDMLGSETLAPIVQGISGLQQALQGLTDSGYMTQGAFAGFQQQAQAGFDQLIAGGATSQAALTAIAPLLAQLQTASQQYGLALDANTQSLITQAQAAGISFPTDPMQQVVTILTAIAQALGATIPAAATTAAAALGTLPGAIDPATAAAQGTAAAVSAIGPAAQTTSAATAAALAGLAASGQQAAQAVTAAFTGASIDIPGDPFAELPGDAQLTAAQIEQVFAGLSIKIPIDYTPKGQEQVPGAPPVAAPTAPPRPLEKKMESFAQGTDGYQWFGDGTAAMLHGWEAVVPKGAADRAGGDTYVISPTFNENPLQTFEGVQRQRAFTLRTMQRETARDLANAVASGRA